VQAPGVAGGQADDDCDPLDAFMEGVGSAVKHDLEELDLSVAKDALDVNPALAKIGIKLDITMAKEGPVDELAATNQLKCKLQDVEMDAGTCLCCSCVLIVVCLLNLYLASVHERVHASHTSLCSAPRAHLCCCSNV
jgi:hypothetical protein